MLNLNEIHHGCCLELMQDIPDRSVDMILCDLPYATTQNSWDSLIPFPELWAAYKRVIKPNGAIVLTAAQPFTTLLIGSNLPMFKYAWVWDKASSTGFLNAKKQPLRRTEDVCVFYSQQPTYNPAMEQRGKPRNKGGYNKGNGSENYGSFGNVDAFNDVYYPTNVLAISNAQQTGKQHPTQKPVALFEYLIKTYTNPGEVVLDCCMGSGTTAIAALNTGRQFIGIEQEEKYVQVGRKRIHDRQPLLLWE